MFLRSLGKMKTAAALAFAIMTAFGARAHALDVQELNGSDLGMGVGSRAMSMGGAFTGLADDASAMYWNPAGITLLDKSEGMFMVDTNPTRYSFKAVVFRPEKWRKSPANWALGVAQINRLKFIADGDWGAGNASHLIDLSMIKVEPNYVGGLNSRTVDRRITLAGQIPGHENLKYGATYIDFECVTTFFNTAAGRTCQIVAYTTMDFAFIYQDRKDLRFGLTVRNPLEKTKPKYLNFGVARMKGANTYTLDFERVFGEYSNELRKAKFFMIRSGVEHTVNKSWKTRAGIIIPLQAWTSTLGNVLNNIPSPKVNLALGAGYTRGNSTVDLALYGDPGKSYIEKKADFSWGLTLRQKF